MTYKEAYLKCYSKWEFKAMLSRDIMYAQYFNPDRLIKIEEAVNEVGQKHPDWVDDN